MTIVSFGDVRLSEEGAVAVLVFSRPPDNYFDRQLLADIADALDAVDAAPHLRATVLASDGRSFCTGASLGEAGLDPAAIYHEGLRIFAARKPIVAAIQGSAIGGGFGLALAADFRVTTAKARFSANFVKIGIHPGFGITHSLPRLVGTQAAALLLLTGRRVGGEEALALGLADLLAPEDALRDRAVALAAEIAEAAPLAVQAVRATLRAGLVEDLRRQVDLEAAEQARLFRTDDFKEGLKAVAERRPGRWTGA